jgi:CheY-like chemotaxis protein
MLNLAVNARDAMPDGGRLTIETWNASVDGNYALNEAITEGEYVLLSVSDTGIGMAPDIVEKAFEPFFTTKGVGKGTGLGLSQVFGFARQSGGHVKIHSELGQGTTVKLYLPRHVGELAAVLPNTTTNEKPLSGNQELVLVVEDDESVLANAIEALKELGYKVIASANGARALEELARHRDVALLFTDVVMPDMSGRQLADRALATRPDLKVLYTTGYTRNAIVHHGVLDSGTQFLQKPYTLEDLARKLKSVLNA